MSEIENRSAEPLSPRVRLSSIEAFHLHSSNDDWPNCVISRYHFRGSIDVEFARQAWQHCLARQKHFCRPIEGNSFVGPVLDGSSSDPAKAGTTNSSFHDQIVETWPECETEFVLADTNDRGLPKIAVRNGTGFGLWCLRSKSNDKVTLIFACDHTLADGAAAVSFVRQWMTVYHNLSTGVQPDQGLVKLDWERWKFRSKLGLLKWSFIKYLPCQAIGVFGATKFIFRKFSTIEQKTDSPPATQKSPGIIGRTIEPKIVAELNDRAQRLNVSTNSLLMTILFRAMKRVRSQLESDQTRHCCWQERKWIRLVLPIGTRGIADRKLPSTNKASIVQIERTFEQVADADTAAQSIDREVRIIMGFKLDQTFLIAIRMISAFPKLLRWVAANEKSRGTVVFTNLGEPFRKTRACNFRDVGGLELQDYDLCGPIRSGTPLNILWSTFRRSISDQPEVHGRISIHFDRHLFTAAEAKLVADALERELLDTVF